MVYAEQKQKRQQESLARQMQSLTEARKAVLAASVPTAPKAASTSGPSASKGSLLGAKASQAAPKATPLAMVKLEVHPEATHLLHPKNQLLPAKPAGYLLVAKASLAAPKEKAMPASKASLAASKASRSLLPAGLKRPASKSPPLDCTKVKMRGSVASLGTGSVPSAPLEASQAKGNALISAMRGGEDVGQRGLGQDCL